MKRYKMIAVLTIVALLAVMLSACKIIQNQKPVVTVKVNGTELQATETVYSTEVENEVTQATIEATTSAGEITGAGTFNLEEGDNEFILTVNAYGAENKYTVKITRKLADVTLTEVKIGDSVISADADGVYRHTVENDVKTVTVTATPKTADATVEGDGEKTLVVGKNEITLTVKKGKANQTYKVEITRKAADLTVKSVKIGETLLTRNEAGAYVFTVENEVTEVTIAAEANNDKATVEGDGKKENLTIGDNLFNFTVSVENEKAIYTVIVTRLKSSVKTIESVKVNGEAATYDAETKTYVANVVKNTANVEVLLTSDVSVSKLDKEIGKLSDGEHSYVITVTAQDGTTADYALILKVVLPEYGVSYVCNTEGALANEGYTYKYGEKQEINVSLNEAYTQSYKTLAVTYKVGDGEEKAVILNEEYGFIVSEEEATGNIVVDVKGVKINTYTVTYHRGGETATETVNHGENAQNTAIIPNPETKEVLDGYTYLHDEKWVTEENGMVIANFENITKDIDVYYKDEVLVRSEVAYYKPMDGLITYYTIRQMNSYVRGDENGDVIFKVLVKSLATDGSQEEPGKTSFVIYGTATWNAANEQGVSVLDSELNKWFTVKASAADKKITIYRPDGTLAVEKTFESYAADTISLAIHADAAVAAINPEIPEIFTVTYLDENGENLHTEKVIKGTAATYSYAKPDEDLGDGYNKQYFNLRWLDAEKNVVDLSMINESIEVKLSYDTYFVKNAVVALADTPVSHINKFVGIDANGKIKFSIRINDTGWASLGIVATGGWITVSGGVSASPAWYVVTIDTATGEIKIMTEDGIQKGLDMDNYTQTPTSLAQIQVKLTGGNFDLAAVNPDVIKAEFYDTDKTTLLKTEYVVNGNVNYVHSFEPDAEGYIKTIDTWLPVEGSANKFYAAKAEYVRNQNTYGSDVPLLTTNKYASVDQNGMITFKIKVASTGWTGVNIILNGGYVSISGGYSTDGTKWLTVTIETATGEITILDENGAVKALDTGNYTKQPVTLETVAINVSGASYKVSVTK